MTLDKYRSDFRRHNVLSTTGQPLRPEYARMYLYAHDALRALTWHWLQYHFSQCPGHPIGLGVASRCARIDACIPGAGTDLIDMIASHANREGNRQDYQQILQVFAEILVLDQLLQADWPPDAAFFYEPKGKTGKRPELLVSTEGEQYLFEVKSPSLMDHQEKRAANEVQLPQRGAVPLSEIDRRIEEKPKTLPRDTPIKDFLVSSSKKFSDFPPVPGQNILVIVWDDFIYEPISSLIGEPFGLFQPETWHKDTSGAAMTYPNLDAVILIRHMTYFQRGLADDPLLDRISPFDFGRSDALPNVFIPAPNGRPVSEFIKSTLRAVDVSDPSLAEMAEYHPQDHVMWL